MSDMTAKYMDLNKKKLLTPLGFCRIKSRYRYCLVSDVVEIK